MIDLLSAVLFFLLFLVSHVALFRLKRMKFEPPAFLLISLVGLGIYGLLLHSGFFFRSLCPNDSENLRCAPFVLTSIVLFLLLCLAYVAETTAIENESPSMKIIKRIQNSRGGRVSFQELKSEFSDKEFVHDRLNDLVMHGHVAFDGKRYSLSPRGALIAGIIRSYRELIRRGVGG